MSGWTTRASYVEGLPECLAAFEKLGGTFDGMGLELELLDCAGIMRDNIKMLAPYDPTRKKGAHLRDAIVAKTFSRQTYEQPAAFVAIDYSVFGKHGAPHAHLVEFGTVERYTKGTLREWGTRDKRTGAAHKGKPGYRGHMPANPFFRCGAQMSEGIIMMRLKTYMQEQIMRRAAYVASYSRGTMERLAA